MSYDNMEFFKKSDTCKPLEQQLKDLAENNGGVLPKDFKLKIEGVFQSKLIKELLVDSGYIHDGDSFKKRVEMKSVGDELEITVEVHL